MQIAGQFPHLTLAFGLMSSIVSLMVLLSPIPTFYKVYKKKSTEGFQSLPYVIGLFSAICWIYYALLKGSAMVLITINSVGIFIQTSYLCIFIFYAPKKARMESLKLLTLLMVVFGIILVLTKFLVKYVDDREVIVGWICLVSSLCVVVAPLGVMRQVIKSKSVEYMPILLSLAHTLSTIIAFLYGLLLGDYKFVILNTLGFAFGIMQVIIYYIFKNKTPVIDETMSSMDEQIRVPEVKDYNTIDMLKLNAFIENVDNQKSG